MQTGEGHGDCILLGLGGRARAEGLTWHSGHGDQGRVRVQVCPDRPGRKSRRMASEQVQRTPLAARLIAVEPALTITDM
jgi:hypothetical protein